MQVNITYKSTLCSCENHGFMLYTSTDLEHIYFAQFNLKCNKEILSDPHYTTTCLHQCLYLHIAELKHVFCAHLFTVQELVVKEEEDSVLVPAVSVHFSHLPRVDEF